MKHKDFEFSFRELGGSMGDFGTLLPLVVAYIAVNRMDPVGVFVMLGLTNIAAGLVYRLPMPLQPKKVIAAVGIAQHWSPDRIRVTGIGLGVLWLLLSVTGAIDMLVRHTPRAVVRGIQVALGVQLLIAGAAMVGELWWLGLLSVLLAALLKDNRRAPASLVLVLLGLGIVGWRGELLPALRISVGLPPLTVPAWQELWPGMVGAGFA